MSKYQIQPYSYEQATKLGVVILPSLNIKKKIDVYEKVKMSPLKYTKRKPKESKNKVKNPVGNKKVASIGAIGYKDYPTYLKEDGKEVAEEKRRLYKIRHKGEEKKKGTPGYYAWHLLW